MFTLEQLKEMREGITPGPWECQKMFDTDETLTAKGNGKWWVSGTTPENRLGTPGGQPIIAEVFDPFAEILPPQNRTLIASAPSILDLAISLYEENEALKATIEKDKDDFYKTAGGYEIRNIAEKAKAEERNQILEALENMAYDDDIAETGKPVHQSVIWKACDLIRKRGGGE